MFTLEKCCCIASVRTGTLCIGIFYMASSVIHFFVSLSQRSATFYDEDYKVWMTMHFFQSIINGCLLFGAMKDSKYFLIPWMVFYGSFLVIGTFFLIVIAIIVPISLVFLLIMAPFGYFWYVVLSYYISLDPTRNIDSTAYYKEPPVYDNSMKYPEVV